MLYFWNLGKPVKTIILKSSYLKIIKSIIFSSVFIVTLWSCEKDEICLEETTPKLIIRFYDFDNPNDLKNVINITVELEGIDGIYENETITALTDSIAIPIKTTEDITKFRLTVNEREDIEETNEDSFEIIYTREDFFVSRSCGYKTLYYGILPNLIADNNNWIKDLITVKNPQDVLNENEAHVKIYH